MLRYGSLSKRRVNLMRSLCHVLRRSCTPTSCALYVIFSRDLACAALIKYSEVCSHTSFGNKGGQMLPYSKTPPTCACVALIYGWTLKPNHFKDNRLWQRFVPSGEEMKKWVMAWRQKEIYSQKIFPLAPNDHEPFTSALFSQGWDIYYQEDCEIYGLTNEKHS